MDVEVTVSYAARRPHCGNHKFRSERRTRTFVRSMPIVDEECYPIARSLESDDTEISDVRLHMVRRIKKTGE